jgi:Tol biopolymer transport system component
VQYPSEWNAKVSPDGTRIVFYAYYGNLSGTYVANVDGSGVTHVSQQGASQGYAWSPDGRYVFTFSGANLIRIELSTGSVTTVAQNLSEYRFALSPDGKLVAFSTGNGYEYNMGVANSDGTGYRQLTSKPTWASGMWNGCFAFSWSADSQYIIGTCYFGGGMPIVKVPANLTSPTNNPQSIGGGHRSRYPTLFGYAP